MRSIFGVDPGLHVGLVRYEPDTQRVELEVAPPFQAADWVQQRLRPGDIIGCERYTEGRTAKSNQTDVQEVIGMLKLLAYRSSATFVLQNSADATKVVSNDVIRALGWWRRGDPDHVRRAAAQAAFLLFRLRPDEFERRTGPGIVV